MIWNLLEGAAEKPDQGGTSWGSIIIMVVLLVAVVGLFIWQSRSNKKKQKEAQDMVSALKIGDRVKTIGGICGFVEEINDAENTFVLRTGSEGHENYVKFDKGAIYQTAPNQGNAVPAPAKPEEVKTEEVKEDAKTEEVKEDTKAEEVKADKSEEKPAKKAKKSSSKKVAEKKAEAPVAEEKPADAE